jgi:hypothetical protein
VPADTEQIGLKRFRVADCQVSGERPQAIQMLLTAALHFARDREADLVEVLGFNMKKRRSLEQLRPHQRKIPSWPFLYKVRSDHLRAPLSAEEAWDPCPYDGDAAL